MLPKLILALSGLSPDYYKIIRNEIYQCIVNNKDMLEVIKGQKREKDLENIKKDNGFIHIYYLASFCKKYNFNIFYKQFCKEKQRFVWKSIFPYKYKDEMEKIYLKLYNNSSEENEFTL